MARHGKARQGMARRGTALPMNYPSVTTILKPYSGFGEGCGIPDAALQRASERGILVHTHCAAYAKKIFCPSPTPEIEGYVHSFKRWFDSYVDEVLICEEELVDEELGFMGHPDLVVFSGKLGGVILIDEKTPVLSRRVWGAQIAAYKRLILKRLPEVDRTGSLQLNRDGKPPKFHEYTDDDPRYFAAFYGALIAYKFLIDQGRISNG